MNTLLSVVFWITTITANVITITANITATHNVTSAINVTAAPNVTAPPPRVSSGGSSIGFW